MSLLGDDDSPIFIVFMMLLVGALQFALVFSINNFYLKDIVSKEWVKASTLLVVYVITMTVSVTFSFTFWYESFSAENYAKRSSELQLNKLKDSLLETSASFSSMVNSLNKLSNHSAVTSSKEKLYGGTCGGRAMSGEGPLTWLRADDAKYTMKYSKDIQQLQKALSLEIDEVSGYLERFKPKGDVERFNREVNNRVKRINIDFLQNDLLSELKTMLSQRSGGNRKNISVVSRKTHNTSVESCMDREFTRGANKVIKKLDAIHPINALHFFNVNDKSKLFARTTGVLVAIFDPSYHIKKVEEISSPNDITDDDIRAVSAGFLIDFLILCIALYAKEPKDDFLFLTIMIDIANGKYSTELFEKINPYLAEINSSFLIAIPNIIGDREIEQLKHLVLYMQKYKLAEFYASDLKAKDLIPYFSKSLQKSYPDKSFRIYKIDKEKFHDVILQNIERGVLSV